MRTEYRIGQVADLLGVSPDTVRRWADSGRLAMHRTPGGERVIEGAALARLLVEEAAPRHHETPQSARNRFPGVVTAVEKGSIMAKVEIHAGPHRIVSLMSAEAADELGLVTGGYAVAVVKATSVIVETPGGTS
jgi:molybdopterin-binding protein